MCSFFGHSVNSRFICVHSQEIKAIGCNPMIVGLNPTGYSSTALRWGVARLAIGRNDAAVNKRTSERLWNALGLKQFASAAVVHLGIKSLKWKLSLPRSLLCGISSAGTSVSLTS